MCIGTSLPCTRVVPGLLAWDGRLGYFVCSFTEYVSLPTVQYLQSWVASCSAWDDLAGSVVAEGCVQLCICACTAREPHMKVKGFV